jgi:hypothetical protein
MARVLIVARGIHCCPNFFYIYFARIASLYCEEYVNTHIWLRRDCERIVVATKYYREWNILTQMWSGVKCWLDICDWSAGLAVTKRIHDFGQSVLQAFFKQEVVTAPITLVFAIPECCKINNNTKLLSVKHTYIYCTYVLHGQHVSTHHWVIIRPLYTNTDPWLL